jgi:hypothetical protein
MKQHFKGRFGLIITAIGTFILLSILGLWSWNTLAGLFDWPVAQYKHILALFGMIAIARIGLSHSYRARSSHKKITT